MRIGVNALYLLPGRVGGTEIYLRNLLCALAEVDSVNQYFVFRNGETDAQLTPGAANFHDRPQPIRAASRPARILYEQVVLPWLASRLRLDVLFNPGFTAPLLCLCPMVTVFHDLQYQRHPEFFRWFDLPFWRLLLPASARRSHRVVVLSEAVRSDVREFYNLPPSRIEVIPHGIEPEFAFIAGRRRLPITSKLILSVSTLHPHKNLDTLLAAFKEFQMRHPEWKLCLVGLRGFDAANIEARRRDLGLDDSVTITGWISRQALYDLFESAAAFVYPSRFEGFGIPVLEALACGIPTACSQLPSLVEIAGDAARFFDPNRIEDMIAALTDVACDEALRTRLCRAGLERAGAFDRHNSARKLVSVFAEAAQSAIRSKNSQD